MSPRSRSRTIVFLAVATSLLAVATATSAQAPSSKPSTVSADTAPRYVGENAPLVEASRPLWKRIATKVAVVSLNATSSALNLVAGSANAATSVVEASSCTGPLGVASQCIAYVTKEVDKVRAESLPTSPTPVAPDLRRPISPDSLPLGDNAVRSRPLIE